MKFLCNADCIVGWDRYDDGYKIVFNPDELTWSYCFPKNNVYQKVNGTKTFGLSLDWDRSKFHELRDRTEIPKINKGKMGNDS